MSADASYEYFSDGVTEEIINALAGINGLKVVSRTSSFHFRLQDTPLPEIARQLKVGNILQGSVRVVGKRVRITAQLISAYDDTHYWSERWDRSLEDIFAVQDEISLLIADKLREQLGHFEIGEHLVRPATLNLDAYAYALKAKFHFNKWNPEDVRQAIGYYEAALQLDPNHAPSYIGLADAYGFMATTTFMPMEEAWQKAAECTQKALVLAPDDPGVHYQLANLAFFTACDFEKAAHHNLRAIELKPSYPEAQQYMAFLYLLKGQQTEARQHLALALDIDPFNQETLFYKGYFLYRTGKHEEALAQMSTLLAHNPKNIPALTVKAYLLLKMGNFSSVREIMGKLPGPIIIPDEALGIRALSYLMEDNSTAGEWLPKLQKAAQSPHAFQAHTYLFLAYAQLGQHDKAFEWLENALSYRSSILLLSFSDPLASSLFHHPKYALFHKRLYPHIQRAEAISNGHQPLMTEQEASNAQAKLLALMKEEAPYLNPGLTLRDLAAQSGLHPNQLSWLINQAIGKNFSAFINDYRVAQFKMLAKDPDNSHISILGLAYESGFNSKTVFNTYFKKTVGITPGAYLKQLR